MLGLIFPFAPDVPTLIYLGLFGVLAYKTRRIWR